MIKNWFLGARTFSELEPEDRLKLLFHALQYISTHKDLPSTEVRRKYIEDHAVGVSEGAVYRLFDNLYWLGAITPRYVKFPPTVYYTITTKGERILDGGNIVEGDFVDTPEWFIKRLTRPARKVKYYHLVYILAPYIGAKRNLEVIFEGDVPRNWWDKQRELVDKGEIPDNIIISGVRRAVFELVEMVGYSSELFKDGEERPEGGQVRETKTPTSIVEFRIIDYDRKPTTTTAEGRGDTGTLDWSIGSEVDIADAIIDAIGEPVTHFVGKAGRSGRSKSLREY